MSLRTAVLSASAVAVLSLVAPPAVASSLAYQGLSFSAATAVPAVSVAGLDAAWKSEAGPVRRSSRRHNRDGSRRSHSFATIGLGSFDPSNQPGSGLFVTGAIGTELPSSPVDLGVGLSWYHRSTGGSEFVTSFQDPAGNQGRRVIQTDEVTTDLVPLMAFLRLRFPMGQGVEPYVGAGAGWEWLLVEGVDSDGYAFSDDYDGFGAQVFGGMNVTVGRNTALYGEVLYNASTVSADFYDPFFGVDVTDEIDMDGAALHAGVRLRF